jgi:enolase
LRLRLKSNVEALEVILEAIELAGYKAGEEIAIALDPASSEFYDKRGQVRLQEERQEREDQRADGGYWESWVRQYPIISIEDGLAEDDWTGWKILTEKIGKQCAAGGRRSVCDEHEAAAARH